MTKPDFEKIFASSGTTLPLTDSQFLQGFEYLGENPPTKEEFNWLFQEMWKRLQWLDKNAQGRWQGGHTYAVGEICTPSAIGDYRQMECTVGGKSGTTEPTWGDVGSTVTEDGGVTWVVRDLRVADAADDNSTKKVTTSWLRTNIQSLVSGCIAAVATAAGFAYSLTANGFIKFPTWLSGLVIQWGQVGIVANGGPTNGFYYGQATCNFPIAFPQACLIAFAAPQDTAGIEGGATVANWTATGVTVVTQTTTSGAAAYANVLAIGK